MRLGTITGFGLALLLGLPGIAWSAEVAEVRIGRHPDRVRLVLDLTGPTETGPATPGSDPRRLTLALPQIHLAAPRQREIAGMPPLSQWRLVPLPGNHGSRLELIGSQPLQVIALSQVKPQAGSKLHKLVIDLAAGGAPAASAFPPPIPAPSAAPPPSPVPAAPAVGSGPVGLAPAPGTPSFVYNPAETRGGAASGTAAITSAPLPPPPAAERPVAAARPATVPPPSPAQAEDPKRKQATDRLLADAQSLLTTAHSTPDYAKAFELFHRAADNGSPVGAFALGQMYRLGLGVAPDEVLAAFWYGEAARAQYPPAEMNLGVMQLRGIGINADAAKGMELVRRAAAHGNEPARKLLDQIARTGADPAAAAAAMEPPR